MEPMAKWKEISPTPSLEGMTKRIEELEAENKLLSEGAALAHFQGVVYARNNLADALWTEFKDKWDGERKFALRQIVKRLKEGKDE
jgi:hypothetical protein